MWQMFWGTYVHIAQYKKQGSLEKFLKYRINSFKNYLSNEISDLL